MNGRYEELDFTKEYILEDDRVRLIPLGENHIEPLSEISNDPEIWRYFFEAGNTVQKLTDYVQGAIKNRESKKEYPFVVYDKKNNKFAGTTRFYEYSNMLKTIKLGHTWYGNDARGSGLNKHCKYRLFEFAFERLGLERIGFGAYADNHISIAAMKGVGCKKEGVLRNMFPSIDGNGRTDAILMSILRNEWQQIIASKLKNKISK